MVEEDVDNFLPVTKREHLAFLIAEEFNDLGQINLYLTYCKKYSLNVIHRAFSEAKSFPQERIRKSRAAIFFYLIKLYAHEKD